MASLRLTRKKNGSGGGGGSQSAHLFFVHAADFNITPPPFSRKRNKNLAKKRSAPGEAKRKLKGGKNWTAICRFPFFGRGGVFAPRWQLKYLWQCQNDMDRGESTCCRAKKNKPPPGAAPLEEEDVKGGKISPKIVFFLASLFSVFAYRRRRWKIAMMRWKL